MPQGGVQGRALNLVRLEHQPGLDVITQLRHALSSCYGTVSDLFRDWDEDNSGQVSKAEFRKILPILGLSADKADVDAFFDTLDEDLSGQISYEELYNKLRAGADVQLDANMYAGMAGRIDTIAVNAKALRGGVLLDNISGIFGSEAPLSADAERSVIEQLRDALSANMTRIIDLFREWDSNGDGQISHSEFRKALSMLGLRANKDTLNALFDEFDENGSGSLDFKELRKQLRRRLTDRRGAKVERAPIWAPKAPRPKFLAQDEMSEGLLPSLDAPSGPPTLGSMRPADGGDGSKETKMTRNAVRLARAEAVLGSMMLFSSRSAAALAQRRVHALNSIEDSISHDEEQATFRHIVDARVDPEARERFRIRKEAEEKQAAAISSRSFVNTSGSETGSLSNLPSAQPSFVDDESSVTESAAFRVAPTRARPAASVGKKGVVHLKALPLVSLDDEDTYLPSWLSSSMTSSVSPSRFAALSTGTRTSLHRSKSSPSVGSQLSACPSPQMIWLHDIPRTRTLLRVHHDRALTAATTSSQQLGHRQAPWVNSLRTPSGSAILHGPSMPRPTGTEASRTRQRKPSRPRSQTAAQDGVGERAEGMHDDLRAVTLSRDAAQAFFEADIDGNKELSYEEFVTLVPKVLAQSSTVDVRALFDSADADGDGAVTIDEFFLWMLGFAHHQTGSGLEGVFNKYDKDGNQALDSAEFHLAAEDMGFGEISSSLFTELDPENTGRINATELQRYLKTRGSSRDAKRFLAALAYDDSAVALNTSNWRLTTESAEAVRAQLISLLAEHSPPARISDLFRAMTNGSSFNQDQMPVVLERLGMRHEGGHEWLMNQLFSAMDTDGSGVVGMRDLHGWMTTDHEGRKSRSQKLVLGTAIPHDIKWTTDALRKALQLMLLRSELAPIDLMRAWDDQRQDGGEGNLVRQEFIKHLKKTVNDQQLWEETFRDVGMRAFKELCALNQGGDQISSNQFTMWLRTGWKELRISLKSTPEADPWEQERKATLQKRPTGLQLAKEADL